MIGHQFLPSHLHSIITLFFLLILSPSSYCDTECSEPFDCGRLPNLSYPFWRDGGCGLEGFKLRCEDHQFPVMNISELEFRVLSVNQSSNQMTIARADLLGDGCPENFFNTTLNLAFFNFVPDFPAGFLTMSLFYNCTDQIITAYPKNLFSCSVYGGEARDAIYVFDLELRQDIEKYCNIRVDVPVDVTVPRMLHYQQLIGLQGLERALGEGFNVSYQECIECVNSNGTCTNSNRGFTCHHGSGPNLPAKLGIGFGTFFGTVLIMCILFFIYRRRKKNPYTPSSYVSQSNTSDFSSKSDIERGGSHLGVQLFTYQQLEEATNNFDPKRELGEGGFGTVYRGELQDGRSVAVKRLYENNYKRVEQFLNEVEILTHLRHPNLVSLYGCTSRHSRELLLVYEYIRNGTVADHLHGEKAKPGALPWPIRMNIAVETANALTYLHASDIIHRDVKTNNILLDHNFCVKVADFGLSRLFPLDVTHVSTAPQGTPGYVDPEYHECYQLTDKSDVYSFGVVLIELISSMPAVDITRHRHEINLSNMAINKIQTDALDELVDLSLGFNTDYAVRKMITAVAELAFKCLQSSKELRPSMDEVLETLKEIKDKDYNLEKKAEMDIHADDIGLLKSGLIPPSPDTVIIKWTSNSTTPNASG